MQGTLHFETVAFGRVLAAGRVAKGKQQVSTAWDGAWRAFRAEARRYRSMVRRQSFVKARHGCRTARWDHDPAMLGSEVRESGSQTVKRRPDFAREALGARLSLSAIPGG